MTSRAVVLAAGKGGRLHSRTNGRSKCLLPVAGQPLIHHVLASLRTAGVSEAVLVLGHEAEQIEANLGDGRRLGIRLQYVRNPEYASGNASSLWRALPVVGSEPFLLVMADHLCSATLFRTFLAGVEGRSALAVDRSDLGPERTAEATKVALVDGLVVDIGKELERWDALDTGVSHWAAGAFGPLGDAPAEGELAALMARLARTEGAPTLSGCDVSGHFWLDIDTEDDLCLAERLLEADERLLT